MKRLQEECTILNEMLHLPFKDLVIKNLLCIGLDSEVGKLPRGFADRADGQFEFNRWVIEETHEFAGAYKLNSAFYEGRGSEGIGQLKKTCDWLRKKYSDIPVILDFKRADIANTNNGYVELAYEYLGVDAVTINPYLGQEAVAPFLARKDKFHFVLAKTSNEGGGELQDMYVATSHKLQATSRLWEVVVERVSREWNGKGNCGVVVGATYPQELARAREIAPDLLFLVPGVGAQGGEVEATLRAGLDTRGGGLLINSSRGIIFADEPGEEAKKLYQSIQDTRTMIKGKTALVKE